jgi:hypothetical protein
MAGTIVVDILWHWRFSTSKERICFATWWDINIDIKGKAHCFWLQIVPLIWSRYRSRGRCDWLIGNAYSSKTTDASSGKSRASFKTDINSLSLSHRFFRRHVTSHQCIWRHVISLPPPDRTYNAVSIKSWLVDDIWSWIQCWKES